MHHRNDAGERGASVGSRHRSSAQTGARHCIRRHAFARTRCSGPCRAHSLCALPPLLRSRVRARCRTHACLARRRALRRLFSLCRAASRVAVRGYGLDRHYDARDLSSSPSRREGARSPARQCSQGTAVSTCRARPRAAHVALDRSHAARVECARARAYKGRNMFAGIDRLSRRPLPRCMPRRPGRGALAPALRRGAAPARLWIDHRSKGHPRTRRRARAHGAATDARGRRRTGRRDARLLTDARVALVARARHRRSVHYERARARSVFRMRCRLARLQRPLRDERRPRAGLPVRQARRRDLRGIDRLVLCGRRARPRAR